jgi:protein Mpv17
MLMLGDVIAQQIVEKQGLEKHNYIRTLRMATFGGVFAGPVLSTWYRFIDKKVTAKNAFQGKFLKMLFKIIITKVYR